MRFRLFPPSTIALLRSSKCPLKIHANGLAVYLPAEKSKQRAACVRADGVPLVGVARMKRDNAERDLIEAEARLVQMRSAGAEADPEMADLLEDAVKVMKNCEQLVDIASDELQRSATHRLSLSPSLHVVAAQLGLASFSDVYLFIYYHTVHSGTL